MIQEEFKKLQILATQRNGINISRLRKNSQFKVETIDISIFQSKILRTDVGVGYIVTIVNNIDIKEYDNISAAKYLASNEIQLIETFSPIDDMKRAISLTHSPFTDLTSSTLPVVLPQTITDILRDTYGSSSHSLALSLSFPQLSFSRNYPLTIILNLILYHSNSVATAGLLQYLLDNPAVGLFMWGKIPSGGNFSTFYSACSPNGTCGFQFLYQLHHRYQRKHAGESLDTFARVASRQHLLSFLDFIRSLLPPL